MPSPFTGELRLASLDADCRVWRLEEPLRYEIGALGSGLVIEVPAGFETDGASIPPPLRGLLPAWGRYSRAAIIHDYLCQCFYEAGSVIIEKPNSSLTMSLPTRRAVDSVFHEAMLVAGVNRILAWLMWAAVRLGYRIPALANWAISTLPGRA